MKGSFAIRCRRRCGRLAFGGLLTVTAFSVEAAAPHPVNRNTLLLWRFDEGAGTNVTDASRFARTGRFSPSLADDGAGAWTTGDSGCSNAIHYGAIASDKLRSVSWSGSDLGLANLDTFSVQMRIKPAHFTTQDRFWAIGTSLGSACMLDVPSTLPAGLHTSLSSLNVYLWSAAGHRSQPIMLTEPLEAGVWQELTLVYRDWAATNAWNTGWQIWRDGRLIGATNGAYEVTSLAAKVYVGSAETCDWKYHYEGDYDEFRIQGEAVYSVPDPAWQPFEADEHTLLLWHFDEGAGTNVTDASGNNRHGVFTADLASDGPLAWMASAPGFTNAVYMDGVHASSNRCIQWVGADMQLAARDAFSVQIRIKPKHFTGGDNFWAIGEILGYCVMLQADYSLTVAKSSITNVNIYLYSGGHRNIPVNLTEPLVAGVWQELTLVHRAAGARRLLNPAWQIWKDGRLIGESAADYPVNYAASKAYVAGGESITWHRHFEGAVDEFRVQGEAVYAVVPPAGSVLLLR